ncbi:hypothetical protein ACQJ22_17915 [Pseudomonas fragariae (ex Marin et al. 2024)]|uniref:hypothetical protein n=1 Tax=Pseudomonas TaxID=286 RepID=UPI000450D4BB|nr:hypothetical protein [Pseudomonas syringae]AKF43662.1 hypothetical protein PsyrB_00545 [Pseudomonas syringae pv. syringae B301D]EXL29164.1 hypothetical protein PssB301D_04661 [Pseudomonas syringae pv. syringae str. B301D-R]
MIADSNGHKTPAGRQVGDLMSPRRAGRLSFNASLRCIALLIATAAMVTGCSYGLTQKGIDNSPESRTVTVRGSAHEVYQSLAQEMQGPGCPPIHSSKLYGNGDGFVVYFGENFIGHSYIWSGAYGKQDGGTVKVTIRDQSYTPQTDFVDEIALFLKTGSCR